MSADGPESIPTSADPRSRRPAKKRALTPSSAQAASVDALFAKPDQDVRIPPAAGAVQRVRAAPPEIVTNVQGSSSGAGSGEFHVYKASRRREYERLRDMDDQLRRETDAADFDREKLARDRRDEERTRRNRDKRDKLKARKANKARGPAGAPPDADKKPAPGLRANDATSRREDDDAAGQGGGESQQNGGGDGDPKSASEPAGLVIHDDD